MERRVTTARTRTVVTLRLRSAEHPPRRGELMANPTGRVVYEVVAVTSLRRAGDARCRYRLSCRRVAAREVPDGAQIHPWKYAPRAPARRRQS